MVAYNSEDDHVLVRAKLNRFNVIPSIYEQVTVWKTHGRYRKEMKRGYNKVFYTFKITKMKLLYQ